MNTKTDKSSYTGTLNIKLCGCKHGPHSMFTFSHWQHWLQQLIAEVTDYGHSSLSGTWISASTPIIYSRKLESWPKPPRQLCIRDQWRIPQPHHPLCLWCPPLLHRRNQNEGLPMLYPGVKKQQSSKWNPKTRTEQIELLTNTKRHEFFMAGMSQAILSGYFKMYLQVERRKTHCQGKYLLSQSVKMLVRIRSHMEASLFSF